MLRPSSSSVRVFYPRFSREEVLARLSAGVEALSAVLPLARVVLFGPWATGRQTAASDIDVLVVYQGEPRDDAFAAAKRLLDLRGVEPHVYTEDEAARVAPVLARMTRAGVVLYRR